MDFIRLVFVCSTFIAFTKVVVNSTECTDSAVTVKIVKSCPQNVKEWNEAAARKGCEQMSQSCNGYSFEYHCVINAWGNETIEVCAPSLTIVGNVCVEYNYGGRRIQRNYNVQCKKCPPHYFSNEGYKYQECYEYVKTVKTSQTSQTTHNGDSASAFQNTETPNSHIIIIIICVVGLAAIVVAFIVKKRPCAYKKILVLKKQFYKDSKVKQSEIAIGSVEEGLEVKTILLDKGMHTCLQDVCHELNESSDNTHLNAISN